MCNSIRGSGNITASFAKLHQLTVRAVICDEIRR